MTLLSSGDVQTDAVLDAWALGRHDARYLILLRRLILDLNSNATRAAIFALSHATPHPDIFWTNDNWIPMEVKEAIRPSFRWSADEIGHMINAVDPEDWGRGTLGQSVDMLLYEDPDVELKLFEAVGLLLRNSYPEPAVRVAALYLTHSQNQRAALSMLTQRYPELNHHSWFQHIAATVRRHGSVDMY